MLDEAFFEGAAWDAGSPRSSGGRGDLAAEDDALVEALRARDLMRFFSGAVAAKKNIAVVGDTGSGKTALLNFLCSMIPRTERLVSLEVQRELSLPGYPSENIAWLVGEREGRLGVERLMDACLKMSVDRVVLGEVSGGEAFGFLRMMASGSACGMATLYSDRPDQVSARLALMAKLHRDAATWESADLEHIARRAIGVVLHVGFDVVPFPGGRVQRVRRLKRIVFDPFRPTDPGFQK